MKNGKLQVAVVGCGGIANQKHFPALKSQSDKCDIAAFCDIQVERAKKAAEEYGAEGAKVYEDYQELLKDPEIDVVHVCTPNVAHCPITVAAFEAGKHVMCEKPMAATTEDAQKMMEAWKEIHHRIPEPVPHRRTGFEAGVRRRKTGRSLFCKSPCSEKKGSSHLGRIPR